MKKKVLLQGVIILFCALLTGCLAMTTESTTTLSLTTTTITTTTPEMVFDYLGETPPTDDVIRFDPSGFLANSSWFWHSSPVFSPDGTEMYWSKYLVGLDHIQIWFTTKVDGQWTTAVKLEIEGINGDTNCPVFVPGDDGLYFMNYYTNVFAIYRATRTESGWGDPVIVDVPIPSGQFLGWSFSIADNKNLYLPLSSIGGLGVSQIYVSVYHDGGYETPTLIANQGSGLYGNGDPAIAPDESYLIFMSSRNDGFGYHDLYICFQTGVGAFTEPVSLGAQINTASEEGRAQISADGQYLFFTTSKSGDFGYNPYWIRLDQLEVFAAS